ncbi:MAG: isopentenyl-diphosphate Delta-isomerase [Flavobacteriales bacterium]
MSEDCVILVDDLDNPIGEMDKLEAHKQARLHRAFSVFIMNEAGEMLLHKRALEKYHSGGLWTNACCSHPRPGESVLQAANRRLDEEMGMSTELSALFHFSYYAKFENGLTEYELDHVVLGYSEVDPQPQPSEVMDYRWMPLEELLYELNENPERYTVWFRIALPRLLEFIETKSENSTKQ